MIISAVSHGFSTPIPLGIWHSIHTQARFHNYGVHSIMSPEVGLLQDSAHALFLSDPTAGPPQVIIFIGYHNHGFLQSRNSEEIKETWAYNNELF